MHRPSLFNLTTMHQLVTVWCFIAAGLLIKQYNAQQYGMLQPVLLQNRLGEIRLGPPQALVPVYYANNYQRQVAMPVRQQYGAVQAVPQMMNVNGFGLPQQQQPMIGFGATGQQPVNMAVPQQPFSMGVAAPLGASTPVRAPAPMGALAPMGAPAPMAALAPMGAPAPMRAPAPMGAQAPFMPPAAAPKPQAMPIFGQTTARPAMVGMPASFGLPPPPRMPTNNTNLFG